MNFKRLGLTFLIISIFSSGVQARKLKSLEEHLDSLLQHTPGEVGVAVLLNGTDTLKVHNGIKYPMMSVFKFHQALAIADDCDRNNKSLSDTLVLKKDALRPNTYSPLRDNHPHGLEKISLADLLSYTLLLSDNNACDILFNQVLGVKETDAFIRSLGVDDFAIVADEHAMHQRSELCYRNWSSPLATVRLLDRFFTHPALPGSANDFVMRTLVACQTGQNRLSKPLKGSGAIYGHKTGTGDRNDQGALIGVNDCGFVLLPDGQRYCIAVYIKDWKTSVEEAEAVIAEVSRKVYRYITSRP